MPLHTLLLTCLVAISPGETGPPRGPVFINERVVPIPVRCERPEFIQRIQLYVSADQGKQWQLYASVEPTQKEVSFVAPADGVYWFDLVTMFKDGRTEPQAPGVQPTPLVLVVDTRPPRITLRALDATDGQVGVAWEIEDDHLDLRTFKLEYRDPVTGSWVNLPVIPPVAKGEKRWSVNGSTPVLVRLTVSDLAENQAQAQLEVPARTRNDADPALAANREGGSFLVPAASADHGNLTPPAPGQPGHVLPAGSGSNSRLTGSGNNANAPTLATSGVENATTIVPPPPPPPVPATAPSGISYPGTATPGVGPGTSVRSSAAENTRPPNTYAAPAAMSATAPPAMPPNPATPPAALPTEATSPRVIARSDSSGLPTQLASWNQQGTVSAPGSFRGRMNLPPLRYLNSTRASLHYEIARVGPSGVGSVEVWMTRDDGRTWFKAADDPDLQPPVQVEFPGEGVYGLTLVVRSRAGLGRQAPQPGEPPDVRVEVDLTPPYAELYNVEADPQRRDSLVLLWSATDKNLAANPITLKWAERESGPWHVIAADLPNTGRYVWKMPDQLPYMVYLRLEVRDLAGNVAVAQTPKPILVDLQEPEVKLLDITPPDQVGRTSPAGDNSR